MRDAIDGRATAREALENIRALGNLIACAEEGDVAPGTLARIGLLIQGECDSAAAALDDERPQP